MMVQMFLLQSTPLKDARTFKLIVGVFTTKLNWFVRYLIHQCVEPILKWTEYDFECGNGHFDLL